MLKPIRYTLAAICLASSVGCLALWWRNVNYSDSAAGPVWGNFTLGIESIGAWTLDDSQIVISRAPPRYTHWTTHLMQRWSEGNYAIGDYTHPGRFGKTPTMIWFPHWYPAMVFALAAVAALRIGQRFTVLSALIGTTIVAALLGMIVSL